MASFEEHLNQAERNLRFLELINSNGFNEYLDWQVTACFYVVVHLANGHIAQAEDKHYRTHNQVLSSLNPYEGSPAKLPSEAFIAYDRLRDLSRRSRYMVSDRSANKSTNMYLTTTRHLSKAIRHLDTFIKFMHGTYQINLPQITFVTDAVRQNENIAFCKIQKPARI